MADPLEYPLQRLSLDHTELEAVAPSPLVVPSLAQAVTINSLPPETLTQILLELSLDLTSNKFTDLSNASLVCRRWRDPAQDAIVHTLSCTNETEMGHLRRWLMQEEVRDHSVRSAHFARFAGEALYPLMLQCPNVSHLVAGVDEPRQRWYDAYTLYDSLLASECARLHLHKILTTLSPDRHSPPHAVRALDDWIPT